MFVPPIGASPGINFPGIGPEFGLSNMQPQFFFTPANPGSFTFAVGPSLWLPTATDKTLGINKTGGGPVFVGLTTQGPLLAGFLAQNIWAGTHGTSVTLSASTRCSLNRLSSTIYPGGWFVTYRPLITADWTVDEHNRWTVPARRRFWASIPGWQYGHGYSCPGILQRDHCPRSGNNKRRQLDGAARRTLPVPCSSSSISLLTRDPAAIIRD